MNTQISDQKISELESLLVSTNSNQGYVVQGGETLLDWQEAQPPADVFAIQKGLLTVLIGIAEEQYLLETLDHINHHLDPEWTQLSPWDEAKLSIETLLSMTTGMTDDLAPEGVINETWRYNNTAYNYLKQILTVQSDMSLQELSASWLFEPLGMSATTWVDRDIKLPNGVPVSGLLSSAKDLAKLGQLILGKGQMAEQRLLPQHYIQQMLSSGVAENPAWSWGWWNNHSAFYVQPMREYKGQIAGKLIPNAPDDLVCARGAYGNYLQVVPSEDLVIVRTSLPQEKKPDIDFEQAVWQLLTS